MPPPVQPPPSPSASVTAADEATELAYWAAARDSNDIRDVDAYLTTYPRGRFVLLARNKVERMRLAMNSEPPAATALARYVARCWHRIARGGNWHERQQVMEPQMNTDEHG